MTKQDFTLGMKTERLTDIALSFKKTCALLGAIELKIFSHIAEGAGTAEELSANFDRPQAVNFQSSSLPVYWGKLKKE